MEASDPLEPRLWTPPLTAGDIPSGEHRAGRYYDVRSSRRQSALDRMVATHERIHAGLILTTTWGRFTEICASLADTPADDDRMRTLAKAALGAGRVPHEVYATSHSAWENDVSRRELALSYPDYIPYLDLAERVGIGFPRPSIARYLMVEAVCVVALSPCVVATLERVGFDRLDLSVTDADLRPDRRLKVLMERAAEQQSWRELLQSCAHDAGIPSSTLDARPAEAEEANQEEPFLAFRRLLYERVAEVLVEHNGAPTADYDAVLEDGDRWGRLVEPFGFRIGTPHRRRATVLPDYFGGETFVIPSAPRTVDLLPMDELPVDRHGRAFVSVRRVETVLAQFNLTHRQQATLTAAAHRGMLVTYRGLVPHADGRHAVGMVAVDDPNDLLRARDHAPGGLHASVAISAYRDAAWITTWAAALDATCDVTSELLDFAVVDLLLGRTSETLTMILGGCRTVFGDEVPLLTVIGASGDGNRTSFAVASLPHLEAITATVAQSRPTGIEVRFGLPPEVTQAFELTLSNVCSTEPWFRAS
jgi:hypothetical protein